MQKMFLSDSNYGNNLSYCMSYSEKLKDLEY